MLAALVAAGTGGAHALPAQIGMDGLSLTVDNYSEDKWRDFVQRHDRRVIETFEEIGAAGGEHEVGSPDGINTAVGRFTRDHGRIGGRQHDGTGRSVIGEGKQVAIRSGRNYGRESTTPVEMYDTLVRKTDGYFLDSNDLSDIYWNVDAGAGRRISALSFVVTDPGDVGGRFAFEVNGTEIFSQWRDDGDALRNGQQFLFTLNFEKPLTAEELILHFSFDRKNDGIGIDDIVLAYAEVPLPPAALMLLAGVGSLGIAARRRARKLR